MLLDAVIDRKLVIDFLRGKDYLGKYLWKPKGER